jgi:PAS domain S-box-containing protein
MSSAKGNNKVSNPPPDAGGHMPRGLAEGIDAEKEVQKDIIRKQLEELSAVTDNLHAVLDNTAESIVYISPEHKVLCYNKTIQKVLFNYFNKNIQIGNDYRDFVIEPNKELYARGFASAISGIPFIVENETKGESYSNWFEYTVMPVYNEVNTITGVVLRATDISDRKQKELELRTNAEIIKEQAERLYKSEQYYKTIIQTSSDAIVLMDQEGKVIYQTPSTERITGYTLQEIQAVDGIEFIPQEDREKAVAGFRELFANPDSVSHSIHRFKHKDGHLIWLNCTYRNLLNNEAVKSIVLNYIDITDLVAAEQKINKYNRELGLLNNINDIIIRTKSERELYSGVCDCILNTAGYKLAYVALKPDIKKGEHIVQPLYAAGETAYLQELNISITDPELSKGPTAKSLLEGVTTVTNNVTNSIQFRPWLEKALKHNIAASVVLPLKNETGTFGVLNIYSEYTDAFDEHEIITLERLADNLSLAIQNIRTRQEKEKTEYLLQERVKELSTIYHVNKIIQQTELPAEEVFQSIAEILTQGWQYPEICEACILFDGKNYCTTGFKHTEYIQEKTFELVDGRKGKIEVVYTKEMPYEYEGPFLKEERALVDTIAETITIYFNKALQHRALITSEANLMSVFNNTKIGYLLIDRNNVVKSFNDVMYNGYTRAAGINLVLNTNLLDLVLSKKEEAVRYAINFVFTSGQPYQYETRYNNGSIESFYNVDIVPVKDNNTIIGACLTAYDITERKLLENERELIIANLTKRNNDLEEFSQMLSHNVRGPLSTLLGLSKLLNDGQNIKDRAVTLDGIVESAQQLDSVLKNLNEITRLRKEK